MKKLIFTFTLWGAVMLLALNAVAETERFCIAKEGKSATILVDEDDWKGVNQSCQRPWRRCTQGDRCGFAGRHDVKSRCDDPFVHPCRYDRKESYH